MRSYVFGVLAAVALAMAGGPSQAATVYYNLFNIEGERDLDVGFVTYSSLPDMLNDANRQDTFILPGDDTNGRDNIVGTGAFFVPDEPPPPVVPLPASAWLLVAAGGRSGRARDAAT